MWVHSSHFFDQVWLSFQTVSNESSGNENPIPLIREAKNGTGSASSTFAGKKTTLLGCLLEKKAPFFIETAAKRLPNKDQQSE